MWYFPHSNTLHDWMTTGIYKTWRYMWKHSLVKKYGTCKMFCVISIRTQDTTQNLGSHATKHVRNTYMLDSGLQVVESEPKNLDGENFSSNNVLLIWSILNNLTFHMYCYLQRFKRITVCWPQLVKNSSFSVAQLWLPEWSVPNGVNIMEIWDINIFVWKI